MKILWMSDSPASASGFGNITRFVCAGLAKFGHQVSILGWENRGRARRHRHYTVYPFVADASDSEQLLGYLRQIKPDVLVTAADPWRVSYVADPGITSFMHAEKIVWALYYPIDSDKGRQKLPQRLIQTLEAADLAIVMSPYGRDLTRSNGVMPRYIPPGVDTKIFSPPDNKTAAKRALGYDGRFIILSDARNQRRKLLPRTLEIFRQFAAGKHDVLLHLHCDPFDPAARSDDYCYDILSDIKLLGLRDNVRFTRGMSISRGISLPQLAALYRAADVHLLASYGEGFGLPTLQAAAAGVVPMAAAYSANQELVEGHGEAIRVRRFVRDQGRMRCALIDVDDAVNRLEQLYHDRALLQRKSRAARRFALPYDWEHVIHQWHDLLEREVPAVRGPGIQNRRHQRIRIVANSNEAFTLPVTLPAVNGKSAEGRFPGRIYLAGSSDLPVFRKLKRIFPGLSAWSASTNNAADAKRSRVRMNTVGRVEYRSWLAASVLALDLGNVDSNLPALAAHFGVPCIASVNHVEQARLWPGLSVESPQVVNAAHLGRLILTDQNEAMRACRLAQRLSTMNSRTSKTSVSTAQGHHRLQQKAKKPASKLERSA